MSVRKREWTTSLGDERSAWLVDYRDTEGKRRFKTFDKKRDADDWASKTRQDVKAGTHVSCLSL